MSLRWRLALILAGVAAVAIAFASWAAYNSTERELLRTVDRSLERQAEASSRIGQRGGPPGRPTRAEVALQMVPARGRPIPFEDAYVDLPVDDIDRAVADGERDAILRNVTVDGSTYRMLTAPIEGFGAVQAARDITEVDETLRELRVQMLGYGIIGTAIAALFGWLLAWRLTRPLEQLTRATEQISVDGGLTDPLPVQRSDEVGRLAASFNDMLAALQTSRRQQQQLVMDASHELRTPLTTLRANIELLDRATELPDDERRVVLETATVELEELSALVAELVDLATEQQPDTFEQEAVDLGALVASAVDRARRRTGRIVDLQIDDPATIDGVPARLTRAVSNLLDNADKFSPEGAPIGVTVEGTTIAVADRGPGIAPDDRARVFDRFYRADTARTLPGSGLGLAIVHQVVAEHGGTVTVDENPGGGARVTLQFPSPTA